MFRRTKVNAGVLAALGALSVVGMPAQAQQQTLERVEITGSSIRRVDAETALPVQTINRAEIERSGALSVTELLQALPAMQGFTQSSEAVGGGGGGFSGASIHNIGETRTLVLLNGRRIATWAGQTLTGAGAAIDLNSIPLAAISRIEVLTDGASALYGTDAIAGVVNFIMRHDLTTGEASVTHSMPRGGVGQSSTVNLSKGWGNLDTDGFNVMASVALDRQKRMKATDRDFAKTGVIPFSQGGQNYVFFNGSIRGVPANYEIYNQTRPPYTPDDPYDVLGNPYYNANGTCPPVHVYRGGACRFDYTTTIEIIPEQKRDSIFATAAVKLPGDHTLAADFAYNRFSLISRIAPPPVDMLIPTGTGLYNKYMPGGTNVLDPTSVYGDELYAYWRGVDVGNRVTKDETKATHFALSLTGQVAGWDYTSAATFSTNKWVESHLGGWLLQNEQDAAIAAGTFDPFLEPGQQSAAGMAALAGMQNRGVYKSERSNLAAIELRGSREVFKVGSGNAQLGLGVDFRRENVKYDPSDVAKGLTNNIAGDSAQEKAFDVSRKVYGFFGELLVPLSKELEVTASARHDHYSDFGNTDNGKLAVRYQPSKSLLLRGSLGTGYRAPSVPQVAAGSQLYGVTGNTYNCPAAALAALQAIDPTVVCRTDGSQYEVFASGNPDLRPETSRQATLGFKVEPTSNFSFGADLWMVHVKNRITQLTEDTVMGNSAQYLKNFTIFDDPGTGRHYVALFLPNENLGKERFLGVDLDARASFDVPVGKLMTAFQWTHLIKYEYQRLKDGAWYSNLGAFNDDAVSFRNVLKVSANLKTGRFENTLTMNYKSGYKDQPCTAVDCGLVRVVNPDGSIGGLVDMVDHQVASYTTFDWQGRFEMNKAWSFVVGINNLFDRDPPLTLKTSGGHQLGYDNRYTDPRGRTLYARASFAF